MYIIKKLRNIYFYLIKFIEDKSPCQFIPSDTYNGQIKVNGHPAECFSFHQQHRYVGVCHHHHQVILVIHLMRMISTINFFLQNNSPLNQCKKTHHLNFSNLIQGYPQLSQGRRHNFQPQSLVVHSFMKQSAKILFCYQ